MYQQAEYRYMPMPALLVSKCQLQEVPKAKKPGTVLNCRIKTTKSELGRKFTSKELSQLSHRDNAHVAYRGKVGYYT